MPSSTSRQSLNHTRRLVNAQAAIYPPEPLHDPIGAARLREEERRRAVVPVDPEAWTPDEIGRAISMCIARATRQEIAEALGRPVAEIARRVSALQKSLRAWQRRNACSVKKELQSRRNGRGRS